MRNTKTRTVLIHIAAWLGLIVYHMITGLSSTRPYGWLIVESVLMHALVYAPIFYAVYFLVLKPFSRYKSVILLVILSLAGFAVYSIYMYLFLSYVIIPASPDLTPVSLTWKLVIEIADYYFLSYFLYAVLYWYGQRNLESQKVLREKEAQEFKTRQQLHELEGMALRAQMNPHFIFNSLNSVQFFIVDKDMATANRYLGRFGHLIRQTLDNSGHSMISLEQEKQYLDTYLELEKMRRPDAFDYEIKVDEELDISDLFLPPMLLQPYVENAVKHGVSHKTDEKGKIDITMEQQNGSLICTVADNGLGRAATKALKANNPAGHQSKGMGITEERIAVLNKNQGAGITYEISDILNGNGQVKGTKIEIVFPLNFVENKPAI